MKINIHGDKVEVTKAIKDYVEEKINKLDKYFTKSNDIKAKVVIRVKNKLQTVEVTIPTSKFTLRAEESHENLYAAIDLIIDKLERMLRKNKTKMKRHYKDAPTFEMNFDFEELDEPESKIVKRKTVETKPMDEDEALMQLELSNHDFFAFKNINEECVSVIYTRKDGTYGIINIK